MSYVKAGAVRLIVIAALALFPREAAALTCTLSAQCTTPNLPICDVVGGMTCRACQNSVECAAKSVTTAACVPGDAGARAGQCVGCLTTGDCQTPNPVCDVGTAVCVACLGNGDCTSSGNPICNVAAHQCVACQNDFEPSNPGLFSCSNPNLPACQRTSEARPDGGASEMGQCTECSSTNPGICPAKPNAPTCTVIQGRCGCTTDASCGTANGRVCNPALNGGAGTCIAGCHSPVDGGAGNCPSGRVCVGDQGPGKPGKCVPEATCTGNGDCAAPRSKCDLGSPRACVECLADGDCAGGKVCELDPIHPSFETCVQCTGTKTMNCIVTGAGDKCLGTDVCGCLNDGNCGGPKSGRVCNEPGTNTCIDGCRGKNGNGCPDDKDCTSTTPAVGMCNPKSDGGVNDGGDNDGAASDGAADNDGGGSGLDNAGIVEGGGCACSSIGGTDSGARVALGLGVLVGLAALSRRRRR